jgi:SAM-dependent methyltransferase
MVACFPSTAGGSDEVSARRPRTAGGDDGTELDAAPAARNGRRDRAGDPARSGAGGRLATRTSVRSAATKRAGTGATRRRAVPLIEDPHVLYEAAVQSPEEDSDFMQRVFRRHAGRPLLRFREDFCGTANLSCTFLRKGAEHRAWGIDFDRPTLEWGKTHHVARLGADARRLTLLCEDVLGARTPTMDAICALNFSYWTFKQREVLLRYFRRVRSALADDGVFFVDAFGGQEGLGVEKETRRISGETAPDGRRIPAFTYIWDQVQFNIVDHHVLCHIHFKLRGGRTLRRAFSYDWRLWTLPEIRDVMLEAGFRGTEVYMDGWDDETDESDGIFRRRTVIENQPGWIVYVVGIA